MSPKGRPEGEYRSAQHEGATASPKGRPEREYRSAQHEGTPVRPPGRPEGEYRSAQHECPLTARQAAAVVTDRIEQFGLGALPEVRVTELADGSWSVRWESIERSVAPMDLEAWTAWLEENVGPLDAESLDTSEG